MNKCFLHIITLAFIVVFSSILFYFFLSNHVYLCSKTIRIKDGELIIDELTKTLVFPIEKGASILWRNNSLNISSNVASYGIHYDLHRQSFKRIGSEFINQCSKINTYDENNWNASILIMKWNHETTISLKQMLNYMDKHISDYIILFLPIEMFMDTPDNQSDYEFIEFDRYNHKESKDINYLFSKSEMDIFHFVDLHRRWDIEISDSIGFLNGKLDIKRRLEFLFPNDRMYILRGMPIHSFESITINTLDQLQYYKGCKYRKEIPFTVFYFKTCGLACHLHWMQYSLTSSYINNQTIQFLAGDNFGYDGPGCPFNDYRCFFLPIPSCEWDFDKDQRFIYHFDIPVTGLPPIGIYHNVDRLWWRSILHHYLFRLNPRLFYNIRKTIKDLSETSVDNNLFPCISVHVRRGDKEGEHAYTDLDRYLTALRKYEKKREEKGYEKIKKIFLMTDEEHIITSTKENLTDYEIFATKLNRKEIKPIVGGYEQGLDVLMEIYIASTCEHFIGTYSSNVGRLIAEIMLLRFVDSESMDSEYYYAP